MKNAANTKKKKTHLQHARIHQPSFVERQIVPMLFHHKNCIVQLLALEHSMRVVQEALQMRFTIPAEFQYINSNFFNF